MTKKYDALIIGGGHNGLVCAFYLARAGLKVRILERRDVIGGAAVTEEFAPGFRNSVASYTVSLLNPKVISDMKLADHGYRREGHLYRVERPNTDNLFFFCHFGVECVLLSRLLDCSPVVLWHHTVALTSSVTKLTTEERREGKAIFRMSQFGSLSHLDGAGEEPSFFARFCETCHDGTRED